jgi:hypothetical protein
LSNMISSKFAKPADGVYFIDRDGNRFRYILNYLRDNTLTLPTDPTEQVMVVREFMYFQIFSDVEELSREYIHQWKYSSFPSIEKEKAMSDAIRASFSCEATMQLDPYDGLIRVYDNPESFRYSGPINGLHLIFDTIDDSNKPNSGDLGITPTLADFQYAFTGQTKGQLWSDPGAQFDREQHFDWSNVIVAGGSVLKALLSTGWRDGKLKNPKKAHPPTYGPPGFNHSDVDIFIHGLTDAQARDKAQYLLSWFLQLPGFGSARPWNAQTFFGPPVVVRTEWTISVSYGKRAPVFQIILRAFRSPAHVVHTSEACL